MLVYHWGEIMDAELRKAALKTVDDLNSAQQSSSALDLSKVIEDIREFRDSQPGKSESSNYAEFLRVVNDEASTRNLLQVFDNRKWPKSLPKGKIEITGLHEKVREYRLQGEDPVDRRLQITISESPMPVTEVPGYAIAGAGLFGLMTVPRAGGMLLGVSGIVRGVEDTGSLLKSTDSYERLRLSGALAADATLLVGGIGTMGNFMPGKLRAGLIIGGLATRIGMDMLNR